MNYQKIKKILEKNKLSTPKILVLGDIMLDQYVIGRVKRISPEAPVPILEFQSQNVVLGGAGNVAHNLINLGAEVVLATIIGNDSSGKTIKKLLSKIDIPHNFTYVSKRINTTKKTRFISDSSHLLRVDCDSIGFDKSDFSKLNYLFEDDFKRYNCIILSDYNKGVCEEDLVKAIIAKANKDKIPVFVDPKGKNWKKYSFSTCITPNTKEVEELLKINMTSDIDFENAAKKIIKKYNIKSCLITRGADGMTYVGKDRVLHQKVGVKEVYDVSGAGDTMIASVAIFFSLDFSIEDSLRMSSFLSSEVVTHFGTIPFHINMIKLNEK